MTSSTSARFKGCDLAALGSSDLTRLSGCWRENKVRMIHRADGKVDLTLICGPEECPCAQTLKSMPGGR